MAALERIRGELERLSQQAGQLDINEAKGLLYEFVFQLLQEDAGFYVIGTDAGFLCATVGNEDCQLYLRSYTDWELASSRAMPIGGEVRKLQSIEFLRLCKWLFLHGVWGIVLNEEDAAAVLSIPELLQTFLHAVFQDDTAYDESFVNCVRLISAVRYNSSFKLVCALENGCPTLHVDGQEQGYIYSESDIVMPGSSTELVPVNLQTLYHFHNTVKVSLPFAEFSVQSRNLAAALSVCGISREDDVYIPATTFYDEPLDAAFPQNGYETLIDLRLVFRAEDYETGISTAPNPTTLIPVPKGDEETAYGKGVCGKAVRDLKSIFYKVRQYIADARRKLRHLRDGKSFLDPRKLGTLHIKWTGASGKVALIAGCLILLFVLGTIGVTVVEHRQISRFKEELTSENYASAYELYFHCLNVSEADKLVMEHIQTLVADYASNQIDTLSLDSGLNALGKFPNQEDALMEAYAAAAHLEASKSAYADGVSAASDVEKLKCWVNVIPIDEANYRKVRSEVTLHQKDWSAALLRRIADFAYIDRVEALACVHTAAWYYPKNAEVQKWQDLFLEEDRETSGDYPIRVWDIRLQHNTGNSVDIYLKWGNLSKSTIESVNFYFRLLDANGNAVTYQRRGEVIELFRGEESKASPYEPDFKVCSDAWGWTDLWKGHGEAVDNILLTCVEVNYSDGGSRTFVTQSDLSALQGQQFPIANADGF